MAIPTADWIANHRQQIDARLARLAEASTPPSGPGGELGRALAYSLLGGGKRLRPLLCLAAAQAVADAVPPQAWPAAAALELLHTYSLIHDDLPALDNDDLRRGRPACHKQFGEATAILAGDALQTLAFAQFADAGLGARTAAMLADFATAAVAMVAGQVADLAAVAPSATLEDVRYIHRHKTAALIRAALVLGGRAADASVSQIGALASAGEELGLAFQIVDDILDQTASPAELGKSAGKDRAQHKATYAALAGLEEAGAEAERLGGRALARIADFGAAGEPLRTLASMMFRRDR